MRLLWGIVMTGSDGRRTGPLWGGLAVSHPTPRWIGEPGWPLLFKTRTAARAWDKSQHDFYKTYPDGHLCRKWRFRVVRIEMTVNEVSQ